MRFLVAVDGSDNADDAFNRVAHNLAVGGRDHVHVCLVSRHHLIDIQPSPVDGMPLGDTHASPKLVVNDELSRALLHKYAEVCRQKNLDVTLHHSSGDPRHAIVELAEELRPDLLVVGRRGRSYRPSPARRVLKQGHVSRAIVHHAPCPVLVVKESM